MVRVVSATMFVDSLSGEAVASAAVVAKTEGDGKVQSSPTPATKDNKTASTVKSDKSKPVVKDSDAKQPQVKFFIWEMVKKIVSWFS